MVGARTALITEFLRLAAPAKLITVEEADVNSEKVDAITGRVNGVKSGEYAETGAMP